MKAPLRYAFGWTIYLAILVSLTPIMNSLTDAFQFMPVEVVVMSLTASLVLFLAFFASFLRRFFTWCDQPRKTTREVPPCS